MESDLSKQTSTYTDALSSSVYRTTAHNSGFRTQGTTDSTDLTNTDHSKYAFTQRTPKSIKTPRENIKLVPIKAKDLKKILQSIPEYNGKKPVTLNIKENDIDEVIEQQRYNNGMSSGSELRAIGKSVQASPLSLRHLEEYVKQKSNESDTTSKYNKYSTDEQRSEFKRRSFKEEKRSIPPEFERRSFDEAKRSIPPEFKRRSYDETKRSIPPEFKRRSYDETKRSIPPEFKRRSYDEANRFISPLGAGEAPQVYAMTDIQAYPMVGGRGFNMQRSNTRGKRVKRSRKVSPGRPTMYRKRSKSPPVKIRGRSRRRQTPIRKPPARLRKPPARVRPPPVRVQSPRRRRSSLVIRKRRPSPVRYSDCSPYLNCAPYQNCTPYPMCDTDMCNFGDIYNNLQTSPLTLRREKYTTPNVRLIGEDEPRMRKLSSRRLIGEDESRIRKPSSRRLLGEGEYLGRRDSRPMQQGSSSLFLRKGHSRSIIRTGNSNTQMSFNANCNTNCNCCYCQEKLQFIQPGVCSKRKDMWTNEYAIIPKPQINLIDPCQELDPLIYPRAERPCIRDGRGNPLTDCIGRPLRDPVGKKFLRFSANGSVMDTNFNGNFYSGQPPLCVKCPLPGTSCAPDTTHNWWMGCGYPIMPNMSPFFNSVVATENDQRRYTK